MKNEEKGALAESLIQMLWMSGLITRDERNKITDYSQRKLQANC